MTADFTIDNEVFSQLRGSELISDPKLEEQIALINQSELLKSLLKEFQDAGQHIKFNPGASGEVGSGFQVDKFKSQMEKKRLRLIKQKSHQNRTPTAFFGRTK